MDFRERAPAQARATYLVDIVVNRYFHGRDPNGLLWETDLTFRFKDRQSGEVLYEARHRSTGLLGWWDNPLSVPPSSSFPGDDDDF